jgi:hypothetical protein
MRKLALLMGVLSALNEVQPFSNLVTTIRRLPSTAVGLRIFDLGMAAFVVLLAGAFLLFYFALCRDRGTLRISRPLRLFGLAAALISGSLLARELLERLGALGSHSGSAIASNVLAMLFRAVLSGLLVTLSREPREEAPEKIPVGPTLRVASGVVVTAFGLVLVFQIAGIALSPYTYSLVRTLRYQFGSTPPAFWSFLGPMLYKFTSNLCEFVVALLVFVATRSGKPLPETASVYTET